MIDLNNISFDHCIKCTVCTIYCPVARATHHFFGPKQCGPDAERLRIKNPELVDATLTYCTNCKRCEVACPSEVKIADIIQTAKWNYVRKRRFGLRDFFISRTDLVGSLATRLGWLINFVLALPIVRYLADLLLGIAKKAPFPAYENTTFHKWYHKKQRRKQMRYKDKITYFSGCFVNYNNHQIGKDLIEVVNRLGVGVTLSRERCCGVPLIANGYLRKAKKNARNNIRVLKRNLNHQGGRVLTTSSSCFFALRHEYPNLLDIDNSDIAQHTEYITKFIYDQLDQGKVNNLNPVNIRAAYHAPCHLTRAGGVIYTLGVLRRIPGLDLVILPSECCGIAGTYGYKKEYYAVSQDVGGELFQRITKAEPEIVITDCETCALQIEKNTPYKVVHPISLLAQALRSELKTS